MAPTESSPQQKKKKITLNRYGAIWGETCLFATLKIKRLSIDPPQVIATNQSTLRTGQTVPDLWSYIFLINVTV